MPRRTQPMNRSYRSSTRHEPSLTLEDVAKHMGWSTSKVSWRKGSRSTGSGGNCVEVTDLPDGGLAIRDSKDPDGPILFFTPGEREAFRFGVIEDGLLD